ncbi:LppP/LprE family lipoprotein [Mycobacterium szulgai]|nr:LppP/LprE family lipoprotein [Mycobacterium szulgai]
MRMAAWVALVALVCVLNPLATPAHAAPPTCGVNLSAPEVQAAITSLPALPQNYPWSTNPKSFDPSSNYNPCLTLSAVIITVEGATGGSPDLALLFHKGSFVGVGTSKAIHSRRSTERRQRMTSSRSTTRTAATSAPRAPDRPPPCGTSGKTTMSRCWTRHRRGEWAVASVSALGAAECPDRLNLTALKGSSVRQ